MLKHCLWTCSSSSKRHWFKSICRNQYSWVLNQILRDRTFQKHCQDAGLTKKILDDSFKSFKNKLVYTRDKSNLDALKVQYVLDGILDSKYSYASIFPLFLNHAKLKVPLLRVWDQLKEITDLSDPTEWYPDARNMRRSIVFHAGPTNSGKTHAALEQFLSANTGIYCCPLRLLAREISAKSRLQKVECSLITGEEREYQGSNSHVACTVEMANLKRNYDVAVIDEIQIIAHEERGWAWTRALLGIRAKEIHVCGEPRAISIVRKLAEECNDDFEVLEYQRLTQLRVKKYPVDTYDRLREGDCVVCFTRKDIYSTVSKLAEVGKDAAIIYGKLPPSTKRKEAHKFNNPTNSHNILVATDAVGMGLNLNIKRIVFKSLEKGVKDKCGEMVRKRLTTPEALQIAGRAGRYGLQESGEVTAMHEKDMSTLHKLLLNTKEDITHARIIPTIEQYEKFSSKTSCLNLYQVLTRFGDTCTLNHDLYELCSQRDSISLAEAIQNLRFPLADTYKLSLCPVNVDSEIALQMYLYFAQNFADFQKVKYEHVVGKLARCGVKIPFLTTNRYEKLVVLEDVHNALGAYLWLSFQFPKNFPNYKEVFQMRAGLENVITLSIKNIQNRYPFENIFLKRTNKKKQKKYR